MTSTNKAHLKNVYYLIGNRCNPRHGGQEPSKAPDQPPVLVLPIFSSIENNQTSDQPSTRGQWYCPSAPSLVGWCGKGKVLHVFSTQFSHQEPR